MPLNYSKAMFATLWALMAFGAGIVWGPGSLLGWTVLASVVVLPPLVMLRWLNDPPRSMSEIIQKSLR